MTERKCPYCHFWTPLFGTTVVVGSFFFHKLCWDKLQEEAEGTHWRVKVYLVRRTNEEEAAR